MSKSSTASTTKTPSQLSSKSAWAKGPPQNTSSSPRSQSPAPSNSAPAHATHSRRPSTLGQSFPIKDGVSIPRNNVGATKTGSAVSFGSIDDASATISSSPAAAPAVKPPPEGVKSFGSVPAASSQINGKSSVSSSAKPSISQASSTTSVSGVSTSSTSSVAKPDKMDIRKLFQNPSSAPSSHPPSDTSSPATRTSNLPPQQPSQPPSMPPAGSSSQMGGHQYTPFVPNMRPGQNPAAGGGPGSTPRSPVYPRQQMPNGNGPRPPNGANGPAGPSQMSGNMGSPRLAPHPHPGQQPNMPSPQMQTPVQMSGWGQYYYTMPPGMPPDPAYMYSAWYNMPPPHQMPPQHQMPHHPPTPGGPHTGMPMSPRNPQPPLQGPPGTPTPAHAAVAPHSPHPPPPLSHTSSGSVSGLSSPPPTPSTATMPGSARLNQNASAFVPGRAKVVIKSSVDGPELNLDSFRKTPSTVTSPPLASTTSTLGSASPSRRSVVRITAPDDKKRREEKEQEEARAKSEKERKEKEAAEAKAKEEEERVRKEKEEEQRKKEEEEQRKREEEKEKEKERLKKEAEEKEKQRLAEEERLRKEEELKKREEEEKERLRKEEVERLKKEEEEKEKERVRKEAEQAAAKAKAEDQEEGEIVESNDTEQTPVGSKDDDQKPKEKKGGRSEPVSAESHLRRRPGPLDLSIATRPNVPAPPLSALATARLIDDLGRVPYPEGVKSPKVELNINAKDGKFRYDREFLLQFMSICKEKPDMLPPLDAIGLEPSDQNSIHRTSSSRGKPGSRQSSIGLGFTGSSFPGKPGTGAPFGGMGNFATTNASKLTSDERFQISNVGRAVSVSGVPMQFTRPGQMQRTASQGGPGTPMENRRSRSKRGGDRDPNKTASGPGSQSHGQGYGHGPMGMGPGGIPLEPVAPLQFSANRWDRRVLGGVDPDSPEVVDRKVKGLLNKLTMEKFDSISDQIIAWANKSEKETDGRTLIQVIRLVFEKATDEATWSEMYARLCRKMMEQISTKVQDEGIKNSDGKPISGGQLFRKYLLNRCQEDFERGWVNKEATAAAAATKALEDQAAKAANEKKAEGEEEVALYSDEYYAAQKAKRQGLGLIKFIGELFKLQMLTERIMHECVKKLLGNVDNPEEEEIESLCKLLSTVGAILDTTKARAHMDVYFSRMKELTKSSNVSSRMQFMLQDVIELRERKWITRNAVAAPTTIAKVHEIAAKEKEKEGFQRTISMSRGGSRRGGDRSDYQQVGPDGWAVAGGGNAPRPPPKVGDLSNFGKINKGSGAPMTFGPGSVFAGKKDNKRESLSRTNSSANMFQMLQNVDPATEAAARSSRPPSRKPSVDLGSGGAPDPAHQRKRLILQPRSKPLEQDTTRPHDTDGSSDEEVAEEPELEMSEAEAKKKIEEDTKEFFGVRSLDEAEIYFSKLPSNHHHRLVDKLVSMAIESKEADAKLVGEFFERASSKKLCSSSAFEEAFASITELLDDIAIDAPKAPNLLAIMMKGAGLSEEQRTQIAAKSPENGDKLLELLS